MKQGPISIEQSPCAAAEFGDAALLLVGHGSTLNADSAVPTHLQADALRNRRIFAEVSTCFWKEQPAISSALRGIFSRRVFVVPFFISEGYFTEEVIPRELGLHGLHDTSWARIQRRGNQVIHYCGPVGTHPSMTSAILARAQSVVVLNPGTLPAPAPTDCSLFIAGHGTGNNENSRKAIEAQVERVADLGIYRDVHAIFMEEEPRIEAVYELGRTDNLVVVPFFIADGLHSYEEIPVMLGAAPEWVQAQLARGQATWPNPSRHRGKRVWYGRSIGDEPQLVDVILERVRESASKDDGR